MSCIGKVKKLIEKATFLKTQNAELTASNEALQSDKASLETRFDELEASIKPEQEKAVTITENGTTEILPDENKTLSKVNVVVDVPSSGGTYDDFWDVFQDNGKRANYQFAFGGHGWTDETFKPKYDIVLDKSYNASIFRTCTRVTDLYAATIGRGIKFDTSKATSLNEAFASCLAMKHIPTFDISSTTSAYGLCLSCKKLITIDKLIVSENVKWYSNSFQECEKLENLIVEGTIGQDGFDVQWSVNLSKASIESIMTAISTTAAITVTLSKTAVDKAFETSAGANDGSTSVEWKSLVDARPLCTIALA